MWSDSRLQQIFPGLSFEEFFSMLSKETLDVIDLNHLSLHQIIKDVWCFFLKI